MSAKRMPTVLAVDDDPEVLNLVKVILRRFGLRVLVASGGDEAIAACAGMERPPDLLLTDVVMPGMNGVDLAESLLTTYPNLRVLFMSGYDNRRVLPGRNMTRKCVLLAKPFTLEHLGSKVLEALDKPFDSAQ